MQQVRYGYCGWLMASQCQDFLQQECFEDYNEDVDALHIDENSIVTIGINTYQ